MHKICWRHSFDDYKAAMSLLDSCVPKQGQSRTPQTTLALLKAFEIIQSLSWQLLNDYLMEQGEAQTGAPKTLVRLAMNRNLISPTQAQIFMDSMDARRNLPIAYDEEKIGSIADDIVEKFIPAFGDLDKTFTKHYVE